MKTDQSISIGDEGEKPEASLGSPMASMILFFYNQEHYVKDAVLGALSQTYSPLEIILSDDGSTDETYMQMQEAVKAYEGPHKVVINRNSPNLGLVGHVNKMVDTAEGEIIFLSGGDDISLPSRVTDAMEVMSRDEHCMCVSYGTIKFHGQQVPNAEEINSVEAVETSHSSTDYLANCSFHLNGAARAVRKKVFDYFGPISTECPTEDSVLLLRSLLIGNAISSTHAQVLYRIHDENLFASDRKYQLDYRRIFEQYVVDIELAADRGVIPESDKDALFHALRMRTERGEIKNGIYHAKNRFTYVIMQVLRSSAYGWGEKLRMLRRAMSKR
ncbi:glycosyltransferase [Akkermansiaceae bacterium]|nr:glycosyltransferase [Akkermansiaceae bacterium]